MLRIINTIPDYDSLTEFSCMTEWETKRVMAQFRKKYNIPEEDVHMGDGAEAESGQGLPTQPEEEQADEPQADDADAARESERSGKAAPLTVSEEVGVCIYCGSAQHGHDECEDPKKAKHQERIERNPCIA